MEEDEYLTVREAATIAKVEPLTIADALRDQSLHGFQRKVKVPWRIKPACLRAWIEGRLCEHKLDVAA